MIEQYDSEKCEVPARKFKALGHPARLWIAQQLLGGEHCVHEFVDQTDLDFSTVSLHLRELKAADVVATEKRGKEIYYSLKCACVRQFLSCIAEKTRAGGMSGGEEIKQVSIRMAFTENNQGEQNGTQGI